MAYEGIRRDVVRLDLARSRAWPNPTLRYRQGDSGAAVAVLMTLDGEPYHPEEALSVHLVAECPGGLIDAEMAVEGCEATYLVGAPFTNRAGGMLPYVVVRHGEEVAYSTDAFKVVVEPAADLPPAEAERYRCEVDALMGTLAQRWEDLEAEVRAVLGEGGAVGRDGEDGATFTPSVSAEGVLSWENDKGLSNPEPVSVVGPPVAVSVGAVGVVEPGGEAAVVCRQDGARVVLDFALPAGGDSVPEMGEAEIDGLFE